MLVLASATGGMHSYRIATKTHAQLSVLVLRRHLAVQFQHHSAIIKHGGAAPAFLTTDSKRSLSVISFRPYTLVASVSLSRMKAFSS